jgi:serine protease AprX
MSKVRRALLALTILGGALQAGQAPALRTADSPRVETGVFQATAPVTLIARFRSGVPSTLAALPGAHILYRFASVPAVLLTATPDAAHRIAALKDLAYLETDKPIRFALETATKASRAKHVFDPSFGAANGASPLADPDGHTIDGRGVGVAIVDSGLDGTHPDFAVPGKVGGNYIVTPQGLIASTYTDEAAAHGTHVAGIAVGNGLTSGGVHRGAAPGATVYGFGVGAGGTVAFASIAFDWILAHGAEQNPPIKVVSNSWGCTGAACQAFNPDQIHQVLASQLASSGRVVTFAVGNDAGDGFVSNTNVEANNQTPGIIGVANYDDQDSGKRDLCLAASSSRGSSRDATTWPDLAAPGSKIMSTYPLGVDASGNTRQPGVGGNEYREMSGTSMATPHVAGIAALMLQANPSLTGAQIEYLLKSTATKLTVIQRCWSSVGRPRIGYINADPLDTLDGSNFDNGHGLVDAHGAVFAAQTFNGIPAMPAAAQIPDSFVVSEESIEVTEALFMHPGGGLDATPNFGAPATQITDTARPARFLTSVADAPRDIDGIAVQAWLGFVVPEVCASRVLPGPLMARADVARVAANGDVEQIAAARLSTVFNCPLKPFMREFVFPLEEPVHLDAGDRLRISVRGEKTAPTPNADIPSAETAVLYMDSSVAPSQVLLGEAVERPTSGGEAECLIRLDCAVLSAKTPAASILCGPSTTSVSWVGAPGTGISTECSGSTTACVVPGLPGEPWAACQSDAQVKSPWSHWYGGCQAFSIYGEIEGSGRCYSTKYAEDEEQKPAPLEGEE